MLEITTTRNELPDDLVVHREELALRRLAAGPAHLETSDPTLLSAQVTWKPTQVVLDGDTRMGQRAELGGHWTVVVHETDHRTVIVCGRGSPELNQQIVLRSLAPAEVHQAAER